MPVKIDSDYWKYRGLTSSASPALKLALDLPSDRWKFWGKSLKIYKINNLHEHIWLHFQNLVDCMWYTKHIHCEQYLYLGSRT